jgi:lysophospholipase L1-like esterase
MKRAKQAHFKSVVIICFLAFLTACSSSQPTLSPLADDAVILAYGDSLTFGTGSNTKTESYPAVLAKLTRRQVVNAGVPGEVSSEGLERLTNMLEHHKPDLVILCHGGNDLIRRLDKRQLQSNLNQMINLIQQQGAQVVMVAVPTLGLGLTVPNLYPELASQHQLAIEMDVLVDVESDPTLKSDPIHPNAEGYQIMASQIYQLLQQVGAVH